MGRQAATRRLLAQQNWTQVTSSTGEFRMGSVPMDEADLLIEAPGFISVIEAIKPIPYAAADECHLFALSPQLAKGQLRVVLQWHPEKVALSSCLKFSTCSVSEANRECAKQD